MNNLSLAFSVVFPLFCMMALGYALRFTPLLPDSFAKQLNTLCFQVFLPAVLFVNIYQSDFQASFSPRLILFAVACVLVAFAALMLLVFLFEKKQENRGVMVQGIFRSNFILFGVPITASLYGDENTSVTAILLAFIIPLFNLLSILALSCFGKQKKSVGTVLRQVLQNPLILAAALAFFFILTKLRLPLVLERTLSDLAKVATPLALIVLGASFQFGRLSKHLAPLCAAVLGKLVLMPLLFLPLAIWAGFRGPALAALLAMLASPTAVSTFTMAQSVGANDELAGQIVVASSILSILTLFIGVGVLRGLQFI